MTRFFRWCILFFLAAGANFWVGLKYPDVEPTIWGLLTTCLYLILFACRPYKGFLLVAAAGSLLTAFLLSIESYMIDFTVLGFLSSVQYPLYALFILPLFGLQLIFSLPLAAFAFLCAGCYLLLYILHLLRRQNNKQA